MECCLCGSTKADRKIDIDGAVLSACDECIKFGKEVFKTEFKKSKNTAIIPEVEVILEDFSKIIRKERQRKNLKQDELAKKLNIKASFVKRMEEGWEPPTIMLRKIEKFFNLKLVEDTN